uniref:Uncharacterized protein n=1 Tax=Nelumbo nucifera TaxID=4432 RepID=A0A822ZNL5_NELNU|nr:TPA_asm: hypothetical protein HUJ06_003189 [Nelumbo nucifera]
MGNDGGGFPGRRMPTEPFSSEHMHRNSASLRVESRTIWPFSTLMNFKSLRDHSITHDLYAVFL